jgi:hypothetical protein
MAAEIRELMVNGHVVSVKVFRERRNSVRIYMGKEGVIVRMPLGLNPEFERRQWARMTDWLARHDQKRPGTLAQYEERGDYRDGDELFIGGRRFTIRVVEEARNSYAGRLEKGEILLKVAAGQPDAARREAMRTVLSRLMAQTFLPQITQRVQELNARFFQKTIKSVRLKYNHSNWGSCSSSGNINLSTRLLFAPQEVIDYVIVHELAHLVELNHSDRFWKLVAQAMPDYAQYEKWLNENGHRCDF